MNDFSSTRLPQPYLLGVPGTLGWAATKIVHLIQLLHGEWRITVVAAPAAAGAAQRPGLP